MRLAHLAWALSQQPGSTKAKAAGDQLQLKGVVAASVDFGLDHNQISAAVAVVVNAFDA